MFHLEWPAMSNEAKYDPALHVVLYQPEIPHNTGSVGRTCVATGAKLWLVEPLGFRLDDYYLRRAGLDYWPFLEWEVVPDWSALVSRLAGSRFWFFSKSGSRDYHQVAFQQGDVIVFGSESQGLPESLRAVAGDSLAADSHSAASSQPESIERRGHRALRSPAARDCLGLRGAAPQPKTIGNQGIEV